VWEAETTSSRAVALKFLPCDHGSTASEENRSIQMVRQLSHPNLVQIEQVWCYPGYLVVSMELADGTLHDLYEAYRAKCGTAIIPEHLCLLLSQAAAALDFLNSPQHHINEHIVALQHCDIKPTNLLVFGQTLKLTDFGLTSMTTTGMKNHRRAGTPDYSAPEVFDGRLSDRTDQYALAVTYYQLRTGRMPFQPASRPFRKTYVRPAPDLTMLPEAERPIIARGLSKAPLDRWPSCTQMIEQLTKQVEKSPKGILAGSPRSSGTTLTDWSQKPEKTERRSSLRHECSLRVSGRRGGTQHDASWTGTIRNISRAGATLLSGEYCARGTVLEVRMGEDKDPCSRPLLVRVVRTSKVPSGGWLLGCTIASSVSDEDLKAIARSASGGTF
jgi:serine/threonine protein kinase